MNVGIVGAGKIGQKRSTHLGKHTLAAVADLSLEAPKHLNTITTY